MISASDHKVISVSTCYMYASSSIVSQNITLHQRAPSQHHHTRHWP
uniref:Uncharacterized protein n=1 Tax=Arundo donax TaxID=35708 RepID=A0A0A9BTC2_ARUDO